MPLSNRQGRAIGCGHGLGLQIGSLLEQKTAALPGNKESEHNSEHMLFVYYQKGSYSADLQSNRTAQFKFTSAYWPTAIPCPKNGMVPRIFRFLTFEENIFLLGHHKEVD